MEDELDTAGPRGQEDRPRGVPKAKLSDIDLEPKLSIFFRPNRNLAMVTLETSFPREAAKVFCDRIHTKFKDSDDHAYVITGGNVAAYKKIFAWIRDCAQSQSIEKFPDIPEPENDHFTQTINIIAASEILGIPAGSLSFHLRKRLHGCARKHLMPLSQVHDLYDIKSDLYNLNLRDVACSSVFNAWWDARLDESVNPELMEELFDMRNEMKELDDDLHEAYRVREEDVRKRWAEKRAKKAAERTGGDEWNNTGGMSDNVPQDASWDNSGGAASSEGLTQAPTPASGDWENHDPNIATSNVLNQWANPQKSAGTKWADHDIESVAGGDWADQMNEPAPSATQTIPPFQW